MKLITIKAEERPIGTMKASIFVIDGMFFWIPISLIKEIDRSNNTVTIPEWFNKKRKPDLNYIY
tara:strand:- start:481 stop:672 length:192 start_codon:yes stop_codon:yes gene_type:complete